MIKTLQTNQKREQEPYRVPRSVQNAIPIMRLWENGLFQIGKEKYSKTYQLTDVNYAVASLDAKQRMNKSYQELLNSQEPGTTTKITVFNRARVYKLLRDLMADLRLSCALLFAYISVRLTLLPETLPGWTMTVPILVLVGIPMLRYFLRLYVFK